jgi:acyl dehydratase
VIRSAQAPVGETVDLGTVEVDAAIVQRYWQSIGLASPASVRQLPLGLALALRGGPHPGVELDPTTVSFHAGHTIVAHRPFVAGQRYARRARIAEVFEKSGRSGPLTVIVRTAELYDDAGAVVVAIREQQIARWRREIDPERRDDPPDAPVDAAGEAGDLALEIGSVIAVERRRAPRAEAEQAYGASLGGDEPFFRDVEFARRLGFADVIVPGPVQSALLEDLLTRNLPAWNLKELSLTFRVSVIADEPIALTALVVDLSDDHDRLVADLTLENSRGERAATGTARLRIA